MTENKIRILPEHLINKIAAGEVVERPASVIKELVENAIDAGADQIQVTVKNGGKDLMTVLDNGSGMQETDARFAVERHATSKIYEEDDLFRIQSLGFRGEALASIAAVSHFELMTTADEAVGGTRLFIKGGHLEHIGKAGFPKGTRIKVEHLFFNTPARLKFLKTTNTELTHIQQAILQQALAYPSIQFRFIHNQQVLINLIGGQTLEERVYQLFGEEFQNGLQSVEHKETYLNYSGYISLPSSLRTSHRWQYLFINGRFVKCPAVQRGIYAGYGSFLGKHQHPVYFFKLCLDPSEIDINVHPAKTEIRLRNGPLVHTILTDQLHRSLKERTRRQFFANDPGNHPQLGISGQAELPIDVAANLPLMQSVPNHSRFSVHQKSQQTETDSDLSSFKKTSPQQLNSSQENNFVAPFKPPNEETITSSRNIDGEPQTKDTKTTIVETKSTPAEFSAKQPAIIEKTRTTSWQALTSLFDKYIVAERDQSLILVDWRAAQARILHDNYCKQCEQQQIAVQQFTVSLLLEFVPQDAVLLDQHLPYLQQGGFQIESFGGNHYSVQALPEILAAEQCESTIRNFLNQSALFGKRSRPEELHQNLWKTVAIHAAQSFVLPDTVVQMNQILWQLEKLDHSTQSLDHQMVWIEISLEEISKRFGQ